MSKSNQHIQVVAFFALGVLTTLAFAQEPVSSRPSKTETDPIGSSALKFELGVSVTDSPGQGVLVQGVVWGGPAARSGIRSGDYIMAIANEPIQRPDDLRIHVRSAGSAKEVDVTIWRKGETADKTVTFHSKFSDAAREKAWLGVMLEMTQGGDVLIADVMPASPADSHGIRVGDTVVRLNAENVDSVEELLALMNKIKAGDNVEVTVLRDGQERTFTVRVGSAVRRTMRWFEENVPFDQLQRRWHNAVPEFNKDPYLESFESVIDRLRKEMDDLREEVQGLREGASKPASDGAAGETSEESKSVSTIDTSFLPVALANEGSGIWPRSFRNYRGRRAQARYRYNYRPARVYYRYYAPAYRYPAYVYPRTPNMMYYGPSVRVYSPDAIWY